MTPSATIPRVWRLRSRSPVLGVLPTAAGVARAQVQSALKEWRLPDLIEITELVASELVTNAVNASTDPITKRPLYLDGRMMQLWFDIFSDGSCVRFEVWDQALGLPKLGMAGTDAESGRGLGMVFMLTGERLGWTHHDQRGWKCVFAEVEHDQGT